MDIDQIINQIDSQITGGIRKKATIFDLGPKERFQMLKEVNKYKIRQANLNAGKPGKPLSRIYSRNLMTTVVSLFLTSDFNPFSFIFTDTFWRL